MSWKTQFSRFLGAVPGRLHFAAHSHHPWPDVSYDAHQRAWLEAARGADTKWDGIFGEVIPRAQAHVARVLNLPDARTICFAPSTHELVVRLWSCLPERPRVLTTDGEFHSFARQLQRLEEAGRATATRVPVEPFDTFAARFAAAARTPHDLVYFSQCFYNTAFRVADLAPLVAAVGDGRTPIVVDGYHAFMAVPTDLGALAERIFYVAGGYKYAMAGEGACFMHCPDGYAPRPLDTGWFASFGTLAAAPDGAVQYATGGQRFMGATFDPTPLYRFNAVQDWLVGGGVTVAAIRAHVERLQARFLDLRRTHGLLDAAALVPPAGTPRGNFLVFRHPRAAAWHRQLLAAGVLTDCRADRLRIGFGLYQDLADLDALVARVAALEPDPSGRGLSSQGRSGARPE